MIKTSLIELIHRGAVIQRWNDHIRPFTGFSEIDKQAHKVFYAYVLGRCEEDAGGEIDMSMLAEGLIFEYLHRIVLTDIKPPVYHKLKKQKEKEINDWVESQLKEHIEDIEGGFSERMHRYFNEADYAEKEKKVITFAHYLATRWEFDIIYPSNLMIFDIEKTKVEVERSLADCPWFDGKKQIYQNPQIMEFVNLIGRLRFQQRWTATARIPQTSVIGHTLVVAFLSYFFSLENGYCKRRCENNFFGGLFHDLPEVLTRDIISPVKNGIEGLDEIIKYMEESQLNEIVYPLIPKHWKKEIDYFTVDEFYSRIVEDDEIKKIKTDEITKKYNEDKYNPIDGELIRVCDHISAYLEAYLSVKNGIQADSLKNSMQSLYETYKDRVIDSVNYGEYFKHFYPDKN